MNGNDKQSAQPATTTVAAQEAVVTYCGRRLTPEGTRECWGYLSYDVEDLPRGTKLYAAPVAAAPAADVDVGVDVDVDVAILRALADRWASDRSYTGSPVDDIRALIDASPKGVKDAT